ncbi:hypothetical protein AYO49_03060 [Verrucomicrobiaceae bacterium SCGC AG-212-N21]|nr:hypothetical protein AYO49_03060 [Verrucomicrobiaceae bacterium SCGC AG-212-N21]
MLGYALCREAVSRGHIVAGVGRENRHAMPGVAFHPLDLTEPRKLDRLLDEFQPELAVHAAAIINKQLCEQSPQMAREVHVTASEIIARHLQKSGGRLVHISTEAVYGHQTEARRETMSCHPRGVYATTKLAGEQAVLGAHPAALVLRVTPVGCTPSLTGPTLAEWLFRSFRNHEAVNGFVDAIFSPVTSFSLAAFIFSEAAASLSGALNMGCEPALSKYDFAQGLAELLFPGADLVKKAFAPEGMRGSAAMDSSKLGARAQWHPPSPENVLDELAREFKAQVYL